MRFDTVYSKIITENNLKQHINQNIAIMAGSFRIPYKYDIDVINQLLPQVNKIIIIISGISKENIINRQLSKTNIERLAKLFSKYTITKDIKYIINNIENLSFKQLKELLLNLKGEQQLKEKINDYIIAIQKKLYSSVITYKNIQLTADIIIDLFNILINDSRIQYVIAEEESPIMDTVRYVNQNCENCNIKLVSIDNINQTMTTWEALLNLFNDNNHIEQYFPYVKYSINRSDILNNFNTAIKYFKSIDQYNKIKEYFNELDTK